jgi:small conductance mechanosensitive channel
MLLIAAISVLGVETTSFAALIASAGFAIGMALSGNLQNFAGGLMILLFKPYRVGDYIESNGQQGIVKEIQIFHTIILTVDNKMIFLPNSSTSSSTLVNYSKEEFRRVDLVFGVEYGVDFEKVRETIARVYGADSRVLNDAGHELFIGLGELAASSVNITVRAWVKSADYWGVYFDMQKNIYKTFNEEGIGFPFPQITVSQLKQ